MQHFNVKKSIEGEIVRVLAFKEDDTIVASVMITVNVDPVKGLKTFFLIMCQFFLFIEGKALENDY